MEARHPGMLATLVRERDLALQDTELDTRITDAKAEAERRVSLAVNEVVSRYREQAEEIAGEFNEVAERFRERLEDLSAEFETEVAPLRERLEEQREEFETELSDLDVAIPSLPVGRTPAEDALNDWMFDSNRDFLEQTREFQRRQRKL